MLEIINSWIQKKGKKKKKTTFFDVLECMCDEERLFFFGLFQILLNEQEVSRLDLIVFFLASFFFFLIFFLVLSNYKMFKFSPTICLL